MGCARSILGQHLHAPLTEGRTRQVTWTALVSRGAGRLFRRRL